MMPRPHIGNEGGERIAHLHDDKLAQAVLDFPMAVPKHDDLTNSAHEPTLGGRHLEPSSNRAKLSAIRIMNAARLVSSDLFGA